MSLKKSDKLQFVDVLSNQQTKVCWTSAPRPPAIQGFVETHGIAEIEIYSTII